MSWTTHDGQPVYWLAPEFWNPRTGVVTLRLPGEEGKQLPTAVSIQRKIEFLKLQGDPRYCDPETSARMKRLMRERLGTNTPWRDSEPRNAVGPCGNASPLDADAPKAPTACPF